MASIAAALQHARRHACHLTSFFEEVEDLLEERAGYDTPWELLEETFGERADSLADLQYILDYANVYQAWRRIDDG